MASGASSEGSTTSVAPASSGSVSSGLAAPASSSAPTFQRGQVTINAKSGPVVMPVDIAETQAQQEYGLMNRTSLPADSGMLFVFQPPASAQQIGFWMKDTLIALSIAFVDPNLSIESIQDMQPLTENVHYAPADYAYAIEANQGYFANHGVSVGDTISIQR
ncbi:MAG TPA: DUF192 domain-containing protein [Chloroflexota bacterium]|nr:DUF192 domain-containing protein [Chloroflexota bacterium]